MYNIYHPLLNIVNVVFTYIFRDLSDYSRMLYPELYPRCIQIQKYHCKHAQVVWALLQCFLFPVQCTLAIDVIFFSLKRYTRGHPGLNQGHLGLQPNDLPLSNIPAAYRFNNITANTCRLFEHCYNVFCSESSVLSRSMSFFSILSKIIQGDTRVRTSDLSDCSRLLYRWALSPLHTDSITSL